MCSPCNDCAKGLAKGLITAPLPGSVGASIWKILRQCCKLSCEVREKGNALGLPPLFQEAGVLLSCLVQRRWLCFSIQPWTHAMETMAWCWASLDLLCLTCWTLVLPEVDGVFYQKMWFYALTHAHFYVYTHFIFAEIQVKEKEGDQCSLELYFRYVMVSDSWWPKTLCCLQGIADTPEPQLLGSSQIGVIDFVEVMHRAEVLMRTIFQRKLATSMDLLFSREKKCDCAGNLQCSSFYIIFCFILKCGGRRTWNETLHFGQFDQIGEYFILVTGLVSNQFRIHFNFPQGKCSSRSFSLLWLCSQEDLSAHEAKSDFCAG